MESSVAVFSHGFSSSPGGQRDSGLYIFLWWHLASQSPHIITCVWSNHLQTHDKNNPLILVFLVKTIVNLINLIYFIILISVYNKNYQNLWSPIGLHSTFMLLPSRRQHSYLLSLLSSLVRLGEHPLDSLDPWTTYGPIVTILIIILRLLSFLALPQVSKMRISCWSWHWYEICLWWKKW